MTGELPSLHICDDWISIPLSDWEMVLAAQTVFGASNDWTEIVPGRDSIALQFDPAAVTPDQAGQIVLKHLANLERASGTSSATVVIPVCYDTVFAPDGEHVARKLGIAVETLPAWHASQVQRVAMLGFMPGFAYLESEAECNEIGRLANPRQSVGAGSIGIIGRQSCIYSFDSPGGWPIIGRTPLRLFDPVRDQPAILSAGDIVRFEAIAKDTFDHWLQDATK
ncbi:5-oxoprolinase subunit B family protein [Sphingorhabdus sp. 109]|uniref:5-oxoprolinase subunit B family protein n=1 Tax=Sphingorhabdus sp. 109 TaxID=2653173 RepID=UPI0012F3B74A|nr:carboxyltransferase domain-containing protein [Sphingorhabdus sp. 109]VWX56535.1 Kinase A inhibitor [Sphingorhabdus sp. 109]